MSYDAAARRDTPLAKKLIAQIRARGPLVLKDYMTACLQDPEHGYYRTREAIGGAGDFVTAPEISQIFGELIGLWSAIAWQQIGSPHRVNLIELGPGRGTLMQDALRAARLVPAFAAALEVHLVESSETLRAIQARTLADAGKRPEWHAALSNVPSGPAIILVNEFLDALAVDQLVRGPNGWRLRAVTVDAQGHLQFDDDTLPASEVPAYAAAAAPGTVVTLPDYAELAAALGCLGRDHPLAALFIDYGHAASAAGDTLQAVRAHYYEHPLTSPGEADLTAHVDFEDFRTRVLAQQGLAADGPKTQGEFLGALGIVERGSRLMALNPAKAGEIEAGVARLLSPQGMGTRFKVLGVRGAGQPPLPGLEQR